MFTEPRETGVPALQRYVKELTEDRKVKGTEKVLENVTRFTGQILRYLIDKGTKV